MFVSKPVWGQSIYINGCRPSCVQGLGGFCLRSFFPPVEDRYYIRQVKKEIDGFGARNKRHQEVLAPDTLLLQLAGLFKISSSKLPSLIP